MNLPSSSYGTNYIAAEKSSQDRNSGFAGSHSPISLNALLLDRQADEDLLCCG